MKTRSSQWKCLLVVSSNGSHVKQWRIRQTSFKGRCDVIRICGDQSQPWSLSDRWFLWNVTFHFRILSGTRRNQNLFVYLLTVGFNCSIFLNISSKYIGIIIFNISPNPTLNNDNENNQKAAARFLSVTKSCNSNIPHKINHGLMYVCVYLLLLHFYYITSCATVSEFPLEMTKVILTPSFSCWLFCFHRFVEQSARTLFAWHVYLVTFHSVRV